MNKTALTLVSFLLAVGLVALIVFTHTPKGDTKALVVTPSGDSTAQALDTTRPAGPVVIDALPGGLPQGESVVYVNLDSLMEGYGYYKQILTNFRAKKERVERDLQGKQSALEGKARSAQEKFQSGQMSQTLAQETQENLMREGQGLQQYAAQQSQALAVEEQDLTRRLNDELRRYVAEFAKKAGYKYVIIAGEGSPVLYADPSLDISRQVLEGLNQQR